MQAVDYIVEEVFASDGARERAEALQELVAAYVRSVGVRLAQTAAWE